MELQFSDRVLTCSDCRSEFIFTAGEQLFFHEKQFKNDPKRCKPCKSRRSGGPAASHGETPVSAAGLSRTETRTQCSECGVETTVPFKPTQGRPVLCRQCFQNRSRAAALAPVAALKDHAAGAGVEVMARSDDANLVQALAAASVNASGEGLSAELAVQAAASMECAQTKSSVASVADLRMISPAEQEVCEPGGIPLELVAEKREPTAELAHATVERMEA